MTPADPGPAADPGGDHAPFAGKVVMITGAGSGFGLAAARRLAAQGAHLALSDLDTAGLADIPDALVERLDVTDESAMAGHVARILDRFGGLDVGINNAGIGGSIGPITGTKVADFDQVMAVNARGVFLGMKHQLPPMLAAQSGAILNMASAAGVLGAGMMAAYAASKHAVVGLTRAAADEVARKGVRVNALCPSFADTPLFTRMADEIGERQGISRDAAFQRIAARVPMRRVARVDEVVQAMLWACDPANSFMTGQAISIDGGLSAV